MTIRFAGYALLASLIMVGGQFGCSTTPSSRSSAEVGFEGTAEKLCEEYMANEVAADEEYTDKVAVVSGRVKYISKDILGAPRVRLANPEFTACGVECTFPRKDKSVASLSPGQYVTIRGKVIGKLGDVKLVDCSLQ
jgi:hypothetical protein